MRHLVESRALQAPDHRIVRVRAKICGITSVEDAEYAAQCGADAIGIVLWPGSTRSVNIATAKTLCASAAPFVAVVTLLVNASVDEVKRVIDEVRPHLLQFHGDEGEEFCAAFGVPYIRVIRMRDPAAAALAAAQQTRAHALLLDSFDQVSRGGTGQVFDWRMIPRQVTRPLILAGGLHAGNVGRAIAEVRPFAVDVSSGVEASAGRKDHARLRAFMHAVDLANQDIAREEQRAMQGSVSV